MAILLLRSVHEYPKGAIVVEENFLWDQSWMAAGFSFSRCPRNREMPRKPGNGKPGNARETGNPGNREMSYTYLHMNGTIIVI